MRSILLFAFIISIVSSALSASPLEPLDTTSPRATVTSFLSLTEETARRYHAYRDSPNEETQDALEKISTRARQLFDLREVSQNNRDKVAEQDFYLLWEVLFRMQAPDLAKIPLSSTQQDGEDAEIIKKWLYPGTDIAIVLIEEGEQAGSYLFDARTVRNLERYYNTVRELPYQRPMPIPNVYRLNELVTGWMIPMSWVESLPKWLNHSVNGMVVWKWLAELLLVLLSIGVVTVVYRWQQGKKDDNSLGCYLRDLSIPISILIIISLIKYLNTEQINVTGSAIQIIHYTTFVIAGIAVVWIVWLTSIQLAELIIASPRIKSESLNAALFRLISRTVGVIAMTVVIFIILQEFGVPIYGLVTGAGVGGIAVALAARSTLENFMGALNLFADRPVQVGDLCRFDEESLPGWRPVGRVEAIGLRSTKIRRTDRTLITIPNADFAQRNIVNLSEGDSFLMNPVLGLRYETTDDQLRFVLVELRRLLLAHPMTIDRDRRSAVRVRFIGFGDYSLNVGVRAYIRAHDFSEFLAIQEDIMLRIIDIVKKAGTGFAFPSSTVYYMQDEGLDAEKQKAAEKQVREWAAAQELPFPNFTDEQMKKFSDTLDYPPDGSPGSESS
jgi:MscS family membrane protein